MNIDPTTGNASKEPYSLERRQKAQKHLASLEEFLTTPAHEGYKVGKQYEAQALAEQILSLDLIDIPDFITLHRLKIEHKVAVESITKFETARDDLKSRIKEMLERESNSRQQ